MRMVDLMMKRAVMTRISKLMNKAMRMVDVMMKSPLIITGIAELMRKTALRMANVIMKKTMMTRIVDLMKKILIHIQQNI